jgi:hypothetical protein
MKRFAVRTFCLAAGIGLASLHAAPFPQGEAKPEAAPYATKQAQSSAQHEAYSYDHSPAVSATTTSASRPATADGGARTAETYIQADGTYQEEPAHSGQSRYGRSRCPVEPRDILQALLERESFPRGRSSPRGRPRPDAEAGLIYEDDAILYCYIALLDLLNALGDRDTLTITRVNYGYLFRLRSNASRPALRSDR